MIDILKNQKIFGLDLEHSKHRSYLRIVSLMQISFLNRDLIVDTLKLHDSIYQMKIIFEDVNICKVIHGGTNDILWLRKYS